MALLPQVGLVAVVSRSVEVVLATCNGARYLHAQLQSLAAQTHRPTRLLLLDDGSSDGTQAVLEAWQERHPTWVEQLRAPPHRLGPTQAFHRLLQHTQAPYVALCDQDDIWWPERLATGLKVLQAQESDRALGRDQPLLLHSDATLIDAAGVPLPQTLWEWHRVRRQAPSLWRLALRNEVTGCTVICNRALLKQALPIPEQAILHDWWLALIACRHRGLIRHNTSLLCHRRHGRNASGPRRQGPVERFKSLNDRLLQWNAVLRHH